MSLWIQEYACGCSAQAHTRKALLGYCGTHGDSARDTYRAEDGRSRFFAKLSRQRKEATMYDNELIVAWFAVPGAPERFASKTHLTLNGKPICGARMRAGMERQFIGALESAAMHIECERCANVAQAQKDGLWYVVGTRKLKGERKPRVESYGPFASVEHARLWRAQKDVMHYTVAPVRVGQFIPVQSSDEARDAARYNAQAARAGDGVIVARVEVEK